MLIDLLIHLIKDTHYLGTMGSNTSTPIDTLQSGSSSTLDDDTSEHFRWDDAELTEQGSLLDLLNEITGRFESGIEERVGWGYHHVEVAMKLHEALLSIRHWESSCRWLASGLQDCVDTSPFSGTKEATIAHSEEEIEDQEESGRVEALFGMLETHNHPLTMTLRSCFGDIKRHLFSIENTCVAVNTTEHAIG